MNLFGRNNKTFKPLKPHPHHESLKLSEHAKSTLGSGNMRAAVQLPVNEELNDWFAVNTVDFYNEISLLYGTLSDFCTKESCPEMKAGDKYEYLWADNAQHKKPIQVSAPEYVDLCLTWLKAQLDDESIFPSKLGTPFPKDFKQSIKTIFKRLFRVYAHIYYSHFQKILEFGAEAHLNTCFKHFIFFVKEFDLIEDKELEPLKELIKTWIPDEDKK